MVFIRTLDIRRWTFVISFTLSIVPSSPAVVVFADHSLFRLEYLNWHSNVERVYSHQQRCGTSNISPTRVWTVIGLNVWIKMLIFLKFWLATTPTMARVHSSLVL